MSGSKATKVSYEQEQRTEAIRRTLTYTLALFFIAAIALLYSGAGLRSVLTVIGLDHLLTTRGARVDCSGDAGEKNELCHRHDRAHNERTWRSLDPRRGKGAAFSLNERK